MSRAITPSIFLASLASLASLAACNDGDSRAGAPSAPGAAPSMQLDPGEKPDICRTLDRDALARAAGVAGLSKLAFSGVLADEASSRNCAFFEEGEFDDGVGVTIDFGTEDDLEERDFLGRFKWTPHDGLGVPAATGADDEAFHVQAAARGVRVVVDVTGPKLSTAEREARALAVMKHVLATLPAEPERLIPKR